MISGISKHVNNSASDNCVISEVLIRAWYSDVHSLNGHTVTCSPYTGIDHCCEYVRHGHVTITCGCIALLFVHDSHVTAT